MATPGASTAYDAFLNPQEAENVFSLIIDDPPETWTFDSISRHFNNTFQKADHYRVGKALEMLLLCGVIDRPASQLIAVFMLYDMYKEHPLPQNPFAPLFYSLLHPDLRSRSMSDFPGDQEDKASMDIFERQILQSGGPSDAVDWFCMGLAKFSPGSRYFIAALAATNQSDSQMFLKHPSAFCNLDISGLPPIDFSQFDKEFLKRQERVPVIDRSGVGCVVDYPDFSVVGSRHEGIKAARETAEALSSGQKPQPDLAFIPELMRPIPPTMPLDRRELVWMNPRMIEELKLYLDPTLLVIPPKWLSASQLIVKAVRTPLHVDEQNVLTNAFENDPALILGGAVMTTEDILGIVEHNPTVATEIFKRVHKLPENALSKTRFKKYLHAFLETNVSVHTMEVINRLHETKIVPNDFLPLYVSYALRKCDSGQTTESTYNQTRLIRLVCVFLHSAVRNKTLNLSENPDLLVEIQAFCVKQTNVKEALALYRTLKNSQTLDSGDAFETASNESSSPSKTNPEKLRK